MSSAATIAVLIDLDASESALTDAAEHSSSAERQVALALLDQQLKAEETRLDEIEWSIWRDERRKLGAIDD